LESAASNSERLVTVRSFDHPKPSVFEYANRREANQGFVFDVKNNFVGDHREQHFSADIRSIAERTLNSLRKSWPLQVLLPVPTSLVALFLEVVFFAQTPIEICETLGK
jgi:hypothetical protein